MPQDNPDNFERAWRIAEQALTQPPDAQQRFIASACGGDQRLFDRVHKLITSNTMDYHGTGGAQAIVSSAFSNYAASLVDTLGPGSTVGDYRLIRELGAGGMSRVYLAQREGVDFEQHVALKLMRTFSTAASQTRERFEREQQILAGLSHPNIAGIVDGGVTASNRPYIVMEYVDGTNIVDYCREQDLSLDQRLDLFQSVCQAVAHAHRRLTVHRDLKPSNIMVNREGHAKLLDFGIAKLLDTAQGVDETQTGLRLMTPQYAAPEQIKGTAVTTATDVYALGMVLFELLTDAPARNLANLDHTERMQRICQPAPTLTSALANRRKAGSASVAWDKQLRGDAEVIVAKALAPAPEDRYTSCDALTRDIQRWREGRPIEARPPSLAYLLDRFARRHTKALIVAAAVFAQAAFLVGALLKEQAATREESARARAAESTTQAINGFLIDELLGATSSGAAYGRDVRISDVLERAAMTAGRAFADQPQLEAHVRDTLGRTFLRMDDFERAREQLETSYRYYEETLPEHHPERLRSQAANAQLQAALGDLASGQVLLAATLEQQRKALGPAHFDALRTQVLLGDVQTRLDLWPQAEENLTTATQQLLDNHPQQWRTHTMALGALAYFYISTRRYNEASDTLARQLQIQQQFLGARHPDAIETLNQVAVTMHHLQQTEAALKASSNAMSIAREVFGPDDAALGSILNNHGRLLLRNRRYADAAEAFADSLAIFEAAFGPNHDNSLNARNALAASFAYLGRDEDAVVQYRHVIERSTELLGERHSGTIRAMKNLSIALRTLRRDEENRALVSRLVGIAESFAQDDSADALKISDMADYLLNCHPEDLRNPQTALAMARRAVQMTGRQRPGPLTNEALALAMLGRPHEAIALYEEAVRLPEGLGLFSLRREAAPLYIQTDRLDDGVAFFEDIITRLREREAPDDWVIGAALYEFARFHVHADQGHLALPVIEQALDQYRKSLRDDDANIVKAQAVAGAAMIQQERYAEAEQHLLDSFARLRGDRQTSSEVKREILRWLVELYTASARPELAERWQAELDARQHEPLWSLWR